MSKESRQAVRAVFLAAIMVISVFAAGVAFSGSATAAVSEFAGVSAENVTADDPNAVQTVTLSGINKTGDRSSIFVSPDSQNVSIEDATITDTRNFDSSNVSVTVDPGVEFNVVIQGNDTPTGDITLDVTLDTTDAIPGETVKYEAVSNIGEQASGSFVIQGPASDGVLTVAADGSAEFNTIQAAVDDASKGNTVVVQSGTYQESVTIDVTDLTLEAADGASPTVSAPESRDRTNTITVSANGATVRGLNVEATGGSTPRGIVLNADNASAIDNDVSHGESVSDKSRTGPLIAVAGGDNVTVEGNTATDGPIAYVGGSNNQVSFIDNTVEGDIIDESFFAFGGTDPVFTFTGNDFSAADPGKADVKFDLSSVTVNGQTNASSIVDTTQSGNTGAGVVEVDGDQFTDSETLFIQPGDDIGAAIEDVDSTAGVDTVRLAAGSYEQSVTVNTKDLTIEGAGNSANGTILKASSSGDGNGITVNASNITVRNLRITDYSNGIRLKNTNSDIVFENVDSVGNSNRGMEIRNSADLDDLELDDVNFSNNQRGIRGATTSSIDGLSITESKFNDNTQGIAIFQDESSPGQLNDVTISNTEFIDNTQKGIYTEKLSNATLDNITVNGITSNTYVVNNGIDINLKYDGYENITIRDSTVANVSKGDPLNDNPSASVAVTIKARGSSPDDTSYTSTPASLDDVTIEDVVIEDSFNGLRIGEFGKDYSGGGGPTNVEVTDSTFQNNSGYHVEDVTNNLNLDDILNNQANDFDRVVTIEDDAGNITGDSIFGAIQPAVDATSSGDTVSIGPGTYEESVSITTRGVTIVGTTDPNSGEAATIVGQPSSSNAIEIRANEVTLEQLEIRHPTGSANAETTDFAGAVGVSIQSGNSDVTVADSLITDIGTQNLDANPIAVYAQGDTDGVTVDNNVITDLRGTFDDEDGDFTTEGKAGNPDEGAVQAILINSQQRQDGIDSPITDAEVIDNEIRNLTDTRSTVAVRFNGEVSGVIAGNDIRNLDTEGDIPGTDRPGGFTQVIDLAEGGNSVTGPRNVEIVENSISGIETTTEANFAPPTGIRLGSTADVPTIDVNRNNIVLDRDPGLRTSSAIGISNEADDVVDAKLNWYGSPRGPNAEAANDVTVRNVGYDPFLTAPIEDIEVDDVGDTQQFAQDIIAPAGQDVTAVGFPGPVPEGYTVGDAFENVEDGVIYEYSQEEGRFVQVTESEEISALDAFVIAQNTTTSDEDTQVVIKYAKAPADPGSPAIETIEPGFNLISPRGLGDAYGAFDAPSDRETIYGTYGAPLPRSESAFLGPADQDFNFIHTTFGPNEDDPVVTPYGGYLVFTQEERQITTFVQTGTTADEVINSLNQTAT